MRRLPETLRKVEPSTSIRERAGTIFDLYVPLRFSTPIVGGGACVRRGDDEDPVRVPALRGALRAWWRAVGSETRASRLFEKESAIWGGVSLGGEGKTVAARRSLIDVQVTMTAAPKVEWPGRHENGPNHRLRAFPSWERPYRDLAYALFPQQRTGDERTLAERSGAAMLKLHPVRVGGAFDLRVRLRRPSDKVAPPDSTDVDRLLGAVWCWINFGGYGARTTRGFGSVSIAGRATAFDVDEWLDKFGAPRDLAAWEKQVDWVWKRLKLRPDTPEPSRTSLHGATVIAGTTRRAADAHGLLVGSLQTFRQGREFAREPSRNRGHAGESCWPEPSTAKHIASPRHDRWAHPPRTRPTDPLAAPRAAFGLPLLVQFKDHEDKPANGQFKPKGTSDRFTSPLRMSVVECTGGESIAIAVTFAHRPTEVEYLVNGPNGRRSDVRVDAYAGAVDPIRQLLGSRGDALAAFGEWLLGNRRERFKRV